ncbi:ornithine decarboxylase-like [Diorhabda sublineata]|uniref:ornithine decarboxylase-like n=1 Tax=Diorhabda sublineata TaxID=1163346 RepID=UPI0024E081A4|nr:ornithine decarboxylase-like [Diorhabda sublineata]
MELKNKVQILDSDSNVYSIIEKITQCRNQEDPFYICDLSRIIWLYKNWKKFMPRVKIFYAIKCNDYKAVLETLAAIGVGFDCASKEEIRKIISLGVPPERIIFANPAKINSHIQYAAKTGVKVMTFDNESELYKVKKFHPAAELLLRIRYDDIGATFILGKKFGANPDIESWNLLKTAKSLDINVRGVAFHVGSNCKNHIIYRQAIAAAKKVFDMAEKFAYKFTILDIGGGYPGSSSESLEEIAKYVNQAIDEYFPYDTVQIIAEPGRYMVNTAFKLVTQINSKNIVNIDEQKIRMYYVDVSIYNSLLSTIFHDDYDCKAVNNVGNKVYPSILWGAAQDTNDRISPTYYYLPDSNIGDWLIFEETGSYSLSRCCGYNGFPVPNVCAVIKKNDWSMLKNQITNPSSLNNFELCEPMSSILEKTIKSCTLTRYF